MLARLTVGGSEIRRTNARMAIIIDSGQKTPAYLDWLAGLSESSTVITINYLSRLVHKCLKCSRPRDKSPDQKISLTPNNVTVDRNTR